MQNKQKSLQGYAQELDVETAKIKFITKALEYMSTNDGELNWVEIEGLNNLLSDINSNFDKITAEMDG